MRLQVSADLDIADDERRGGALELEVCEVDDPSGQPEPEVIRRQSNSPHQLDSDTTISVDDTTFST